MILENRTRRFRYGPRFFAVSFSLARAVSFFSPASWKLGGLIRHRFGGDPESNLLLSPFLLFSSIARPPVSFRPREGSCTVRTFNEPGCRILGVSWWFSWRYPTAIFRTAVMCLPCLRLIRILGAAGPTIRVSPWNSLKDASATSSPKLFYISYNNHSMRDENSSVFSAIFRM